ncbi:MAG: carbon-nitrogen hydrolase family protein [Kofleriaceae bacterium]|nr:carbon-nitrogen hydrolase family protein [Kofleriaceae bacterium]
MTVALIAVQLEIPMAVLDGGDRLRAHVEAAAAAAVDAAPVAADRLLVFPEATGHLVPLALGPAAARRARTLGDAMAQIALRRPWSVARGLLDARSPRADHAVILAFAADVDRWMRATFAAIARRHRATVVAGSYLRVRADGGVANSSLTFGPDGRLVATTDKVNLVPFLEDRRAGGLALSRGAAEAVPVIDCGWGRLATLICYDAFREPHTASERFVPVAARVDAAGADVIANPAANPWPWQLGWIHADPGEHVTRAEQWRNEGLPATLAGLHHARWGVTAHLVARLLDLRFEGASEILRRDGDRVTQVARAADHRHAGHVAVVAELGAPSYTSPRQPSPEPSP